MKSLLASLTLVFGIGAWAANAIAQPAPSQLRTDPGPAAASKIDGDAITEANREDIAEMIRIADAIDAAVDGKDWRAARTYFTKDVNADFNSLDGSTPGTIPARQLLNGWASNLTEDKTSFHMRSNHRVTFFREDEAVMLSHGYAWNRLEAGAAPENGANAFWEMWGNYTHVFVRTPKGWKVNGMKFDLTAERGNPYVRNTPGS